MITIVPTTDRDHPPNGQAAWIVVVTVQQRWCGFRSETISAVVSSASPC